MKIKFDKKVGDKLANILCEVDALIKDGTIPVGMTGLSPDAQKFISLFYKCIDNTMKVEEVIITDQGLKQLIN